MDTLIYTLTLLVARVGALVEPGREGWLRACDTPLRAAVGERMYPHVRRALNQAAFAAVRTHGVDLDGMDTLHAFLRGMERERQPTVADALEYAWFVLDCAWDTVGYGAVREDCLEAAMRANAGMGTTVEPHPARHVA